MANVIWLCLYPQNSDILYKQKQCHWSIIQLAAEWRQRRKKVNQINIAVFMIFLLCVTITVATFFCCCCWFKIVEKGKSSCCLWMKIYCFKMLFNFVNCFLGGIIYLHFYALSALKSIPCWLYQPNELKWKSILCFATFIHRIAIESSLPGLKPSRGANSITICDVKRIICARKKKKNETAGE